MDEKNTFKYTYSAEQQEEIKSIRRKYMPEGEDKLERLRRLDAGVTQKGTMYSLIVGILSAFIFGTGMCLCLVWEAFFLGVAVSVTGIVGIALAYPVYSGVIAAEREKVADEILRLTDELMK